MNILQINTADKGGGAEGSAYNLFLRYRELGHNSVFAVGTKYRNDADIIEIPRLAPTGALNKVLFAGSEVAHRLDTRGVPAMRRIARILARYASPLRRKQYNAGLEETDFPGCHCLLEKLPLTPDIIHLHNMHGWYFDLNWLPEISHKIPTVINLRDTWTLSGHCAYFMDCERWKNGCGNCPSLNTYPALKCDGTAENWKNKADIYAKSKLYVTAPSQWLIDCAKSSMLKAVEYKVIPNGINTDVFCAGDKNAARTELGLPLDVPIVMFASAAATTVFKDQDTLRAVLRKIHALNSNVHFLCVGADLKEDIPNMHRFGYISSPEKMAQCYRAADVFLHTAKAEAFGKTVTEAMACGTPAVASNVGGLPEQIIPGQTGALAITSDELATRVMEILELADDAKQNMRSAAAKRGAQFSLTNQADAFINWYASIQRGHDIPSAK